MSVPEFTPPKDTKKKFSGAERRRFHRRNLPDVPSLKTVAFNQDLEVQVVDISMGGMLLETEVRLRPQMKVLFKLTTSKGAFKISGSVLRSSVASLEGRPRYRSAIAFDQPLHILDELKDGSAGEAQGTFSKSTAPAMLQNGADQPALPQPDLDGQPDDSAEIVTLIVDYLSGISLEK